MKPLLCPHCNTQTHLPSAAVRLTGRLTCEHCKKRFQYDPLKYYTRDGRLKQNKEKTLWNPKNKTLIIA